jgi:integrase
VEDRLRLGPDWPGLELVFTSMIGTPINTRLVWEAFKRALTRADLPDIRIHDLRHTAATIMLAEGVNPRVVADLLGHTDVSITLNRYSHILASMEESAAERMARALEG